MDKIYQELFEYINTLEIIDTHEHLSPFEHAREKETDVLKEYLSHYFNRDLISAGLKPEEYQQVINPKLPLMQRWDLVEPYWEIARYTGYGRVLDITVQGLYGIERICRETIEPLNQVFQKSLQPGQFKKVLKEKSKIKTSLLMSNVECDRTLFSRVHCLDHFVYPKTGTDIESVEKESGITICSFEDWLIACETALETAFKSGAVALKSGLAYYRSLHYEKVTRADAESAFLNIFKLRNFPDWAEQVFVVGKPFQDYMMHYILRLANQKHLTYQFHTGLQEGNGNIIYHSDPALLSKLFLEYPQVDFDIFHIGYPYHHIVSVLAKTFPNVYIDMCWAHIIFPTVCINALLEWIDTVPFNKISAFGGDYLMIDTVYGHQYLARVNVSKALTKIVEQGVFDLKKAKEVAELLFYKNPYVLFKLDI